MSTVWWVNHGDTYEEERRGGYISEPHQARETSSLRELIHGRLKAGDATLHVSQEAIRAIGILRESPTVQHRPSKLPQGVWLEKRRVGGVEYHDLSVPISLGEISDRGHELGPFDRSGGLKPGFVHALSPQFAASLYKTFRTRWPIEWLPSGSMSQRWLFQANPEHWDVEVEVSKIGVGGEDTWSVSRHGNEMRPGDAVVIGKAALRLVYMR